VAGEGGKMSGRAVMEYAMAVRSRYRAAGRQDKKLILDEFCETTGMHRKAVIRLLNRRGGPAARPRGRPRRYGPEVAEAVVQLWKVGDRMCGKLLAAVMAQLLDALERYDELQVSAEVRSLLLEMSPATIDRVLSRHRRRSGLQPQRRTAPSTGLKSEVAVRTWAEWQGAPVGSLQADLVLHCGESTGGFYLSSLCVIDVASGWTELQPVWGLGKQRVGTAVHQVRERLPFSVHSLHTDNGGEFLNHTLYNWCRQEGIDFTRGRSYRKNDQAYVEQRNWLTVRRLVGYDRLTSRQAYGLLEKLYPLLGLQLNFFRPVRKLVSKERLGARVRKRYDEPRTAQRRLLESGALSVDQRTVIEWKSTNINPAALQRRIDGILRELWQLARHEGVLEEEVG
jgi:hypothetical protein